MRLLNLSAPMAMRPARMMRRIRAAPADWPARNRAQRAAKGVYRLVSGCQPGTTGNKSRVACTILCAL
eukprot:6190147-Pleurochrysis_carterae.AAC.1